MQWGLCLNLHPRRAAAPSLSPVSLFLRPCLSASPPAPSRVLAPLERTAGSRMASASAATLTGPTFTTITPLAPSSDGTSTRLPQRSTSSSVLAMPAASMVRVAARHSPWSVQPPASGGSPHSQPLTSLFEDTEKRVGSNGSPHVRLERLPDPSQLLSRLTSLDAFRASLRAERPSTAPNLVGGGARIERGLPALPLYAPGIARVSTCGA